MCTLGYLGPPGTFSHEAALNYMHQYGGNAVCCTGLDTILEQVTAGQLDAGIMPVENSLGGSVGETHDLLLLSKGVYVTGEVMLQVRQHLLARPGTGISQVKRVYSHPQALAQCRGFFRQKMNGVTVVETTSTAAAAFLVASLPIPLAAVGTKSAAWAYGLEVLNSNIQDNIHNTTRFWVVRRQKQFASVPAKTSLVLAVKDRPGTLYHILKEFALRQINLTRIESRPAGGKLGDYVFYIDLEGCESDPVVSQAIYAAQQWVVWIKILGSYPSAQARVD